MKNATVWHAIILGILFLLGLWGLLIRILDRHHPAVPVKKYDSGSMHVRFEPWVFSDSAPVEIMKLSGNTFDLSSYGFRVAFWGAGQKFSFNNHPFSRAVISNKNKFDSIVIEVVEFRIDSNSTQYFNGKPIKNLGR